MGGAAGAGHQPRPCAAGRRRGSRRAAGRCRGRRSRSAAPAHLPGAPRAAAGAGQLRARRGRGRPPRRRPAHALPGRHRAHDHPGGARGTRRGAGAARAAAHPAGRDPAGAGAGLPGRAAVRRAGPRGAPDPGPDQRRRPGGGRRRRRRPGRDAAGRRAGRRPRLHPGPRRARGAADRPVRAAHLRRPDRRRAAADACGPPSTGATTCSPSRSRSCSAGSRCSTAAGPWMPPRWSRPGRTCRGPTCSTCCRGWSTGTWSPSTTCIRVSRPGTGCWRRCGSTPSTSSGPPARPTRSRPRTSRTSAR